MTLSEVLIKLETFTLQELAEVRAKVDELSGEVIDDNEFTPEQWAEIERRIADVDKNPQDMLTMQEFVAKLEKRRGK